MSPLGMTRFTCEVSRSTTGLSLPARFKDDTPEKRGSGVGLGQRPRAGDLGVGIWAGGRPKALLALHVMANGTVRDSGPCPRVDPWGPWPS